MNKKFDLRKFNETLAQLNKLTAKINEAEIENDIELKVNFDSFGGSVIVEPADNEGVKEIRLNGLTTGFTKVYIKKNEDAEAQTAVEAPVVAAENGDSEAVVVDVPATEAPVVNEIAAYTNTVDEPKVILEKIKSAADAFDATVKDILTQHGYEISL